MWKPLDTLQLENLLLTITACSRLHHCDIFEQNTASTLDTYKLFHPGGFFLFLFSPTLTAVELQARTGRLLLFHYNPPPNRPNLSYSQYAKVGNQQRGQCLLTFPACQLTLGSCLKHLVNLTFQVLRSSLPITKRCRLASQFSQNTLRRVSFQYSVL